MNLEVSPLQLSDGTGATLARATVTCWLPYTYFLFFFNWGFSPLERDFTFLPLNFKSLCCLGPGQKRLPCTSWVHSQLPSLSHYAVLRGGLRQGPSFRPPAAGMDSPELRSALAEVGPPFGSGFHFTCGFLYAARSLLPVHLRGTHESPAPLFMPRGWQGMF